MPPFITFDPLEPEKAQASVLGRLQAQDEVLAQLTTPIQASIIDRTTRQENALREVYRPITTSIKKRVKKQGDMLKRITDEVKTGVQTSLASNGVRLRRLSSESSPQDIVQSPLLIGSPIPQPEPQPAQLPILPPVPRPIPQPEPKPQPQPQPLPSFECVLSYEMTCNQIRPTADQIKLELTELGANVLVSVFSDSSHFLVNGISGLLVNRVARRYGCDIRPTVLTPAEMAFDGPEDLTPLVQPVCSDPQNRWSGYVTYPGAWFAACRFRTELVALGWSTQLRKIAPMTWRLYFCGCWSPEMSELVGIWDMLQGIYEHSYSKGGCEGLIIPPPAPQPQPSPQPQPQSGQCCPPAVINVPPCPQPETPPADEIEGVQITPQDVATQPALWEPDTESICALITTYITTFSRVGEAYFGTLQLTATAASTLESKKDTLNNSILAAILPVTKAVDPKRFMPTIRGVITGLSTAISTTMIVQGTAYVGLKIIRIVLESLESFTVGWNLGPAILMQVRISLNKEKQVLEYLENFLWPTGIPASSEVNTLLNANEITDAHADCLWRMNNSLPRLQRKIILAQRQQVSPIDIVRLAMREPSRYKSLAERLRRVNVQTPVDMSEIVDSQLVVPPPSDAISFAVRDVFDPNLIGKELMTAEYRQQRGLAELFRSIGIGNVKIDGIDPRNNDVVDVGLMYWLAHYVNCSPTQMFEMFHRLRPNRVAKWALPGQTPEQIRAMATTVDTVRYLLKANDYNPFWRDRLAAIAYRSIGRIDARRMYAEGVFGPPLGRRGFNVVGNVITLMGIAERELGEIYLDMGYSPDDAIKLAMFTAKQWDTQQLAPVRNKLKSNVCEAIKIGIGDKADHRQSLINVGMLPVEADAVISACELQQQLGIVKKAIGLIRRAVLGGRLAIDGARLWLQKIGVNQDAITNYLEHWQLDVKMRAKEPAAQELCTWYGEGLLTSEEMQSRLRRLGHTEPDIRRIFAHCLIGINARLAKDVEKAQRIAEKNRKERERREREKLRQFLSARSESHLKQWFKLGEITLADIRYTLNLKGWRMDDIERFISTLGVTTNA